jgi:hypothetical protein
VSLSSKSEFAPRLGQHVEGAAGIEHSSAAFCVLLIFAIKLTLALGGCRSAVSAEDARVRTVRLPARKPNLVESCKAEHPR